MNGFLISLIVLAGWTGAAALVGRVGGGGIHLADEAEQRHRPHDTAYPPPVPPPAERVNRITKLPEVPPTRSELAWLAQQPAEILSGVALRWRFEQVVADGMAR